jgi:serine/threonine protein kinase
VHAAASDWQVRILEELSADRHRNMLRFHGWWEDDAHIYAAQQLCLGGELTDWLAAQPAYTEQLAAKVTYDLLQALTYCHGKGI